MSGLAVSLVKTSFFSSGLSAHEIQHIASSTGLFVGTLPVTYQGVPLYSKKLSIANCELLLMRIKSRMSTWSAKALSFSGRLLLLNSVILGITNFWTTSFILPKAVINNINSLVGNFMWHGGEEGKFNARVAWSKVTNPKNEGGLGLKNLHFWNKACTLKMIWMLFFRAGSILVGWFKEEILQGNLSLFWTITEKQKHSWLVNKLLRSRGIIFNWIKRDLGNGEHTRFWHDNWSPFGRLSEFFKYEITIRRAISPNISMANLFVNNGWVLPPVRSEKQVRLHIYLSTISLTDSQDRYSWEPDNSPMQSYSTGFIYSLLRRPKPLVHWADVAWISPGITKHSFITWLFVLDRCPTKDHIQRWGLPVDTTCYLCNSATESRNHLMFCCPFSWIVWSEIARRCQLSPS